MTLWGAGFERTYPSVRVELDDEGFASASSRPATFGPYLGTMGKQSMTEFKDHFGHAAMQVPVCHYGVAVFVNKDGPYDGGLPIEQVETVFSSSCWTVTWGDLGCGGEWARRPIRLHARSTTQWVIRPHASLPFSFKESVERHGDDAAVVASVASDAGGLGLAAIGCDTEKVRALAIAPKGSLEFVPATPANVSSGLYPLAGTFYLVLNHDLEGHVDLDPLRREFLRYILSREGQQLAVKAGHVALSAEQAAQALANYAILPTGKGSWDEMLSRLRSRGLPRMELTRIEHLALKVGDRPTDEQIAALSNSLVQTKLRSAVAVTVATDENGATVKCRLFGQPKAVVTLDQAKGIEVTVPIGLYNIWTERDGTATSPTDAWFQVIRERERILLYETGEAAQRPKEDSTPGR